MEFTSNIEAGLYDLAGAEINAVLIQRAQDEALARNRIREDINIVLQQAAHDRDIDAILRLERVLLLAERELMGESTRRIASLNAGIRELDAAIAMLRHVRNHDYYRELDEDFSLGKNRKAGLPDDQARQVFRSHATRLHNLGVGRMEDSEREVLDLRIENIKVAEGIYKSLQRQALAASEIREPAKPYAPEREHKLAAA